jgi:hypothetical protein
LKRERGPRRSHASGKTETALARSTVPQGHLQRKNMKTLIGALALTAAIVAGPVLAQDTDGPPPSAPPALASVPTIDVIHSREARDGARIQQAVDAGDLSPGEAHRIGEELRNIRTQEAELAQRDGADLNATDRQFINDRLDQLGRSIHWIRVREQDRW